MNAEQQRLVESREGTPWKMWGPYLSERQWGTVREDYSTNGDAWSYFPHDHARSRAYRWGEDGLGGISDDKQRLCFALALWNGKDAILKERLFGLTNAEGNHGEDVKEYYYYLDSTPTHSYMRYLYKYPHGPFPYEDLVETNRQRTRAEFEYELIDTTAFEGNRYHDVFVEYAKAGPRDLLITITAYNRGTEAAVLHLLPTLWFRNTWSWARADETPPPRPVIERQTDDHAVARHGELGDYHFYCDGKPTLLFTENETNNERIFGSPNRSPYVKDAFHAYLVGGNLEAVNPEGRGTKLAGLYTLAVAPGESETVRLRLSATAHERPFADFDANLARRKSEADAFFAKITPKSIGENASAVLRQALAGMLWTKQYYYLDVQRWLQEHGQDVSTGQGPAGVRNHEWFHMVNDAVISMPDKWEYPWYAAWDLAFHCIAFTHLDLDFAKSQLELLLHEMYLHPNGQVPAYEWNFGDVNPPVHAWATWFVYTTERDRRGKGDLAFLKSAFGKLVLNFTWWVNRKDRSGKNVFEGGFLGLDNIGVFDRSAPLPTGGHLEQADGTAWMALFAQNMLQIALELAAHDPMYESMAMKFIEHFLWIASAVNRPAPNQEGMWDEDDGFFYDQLKLPDGKAFRLKVRSMVGLLPLCAATVFPVEILKRFPGLAERIQKRIDSRPELRKTVPNLSKRGHGGRALLSMLDETKLRRVLARLLDEGEFLSPYGIRSLSRYHESHPYSITVHGEKFSVEYLPAESNTGMFGGNSNWRGPIWFPVNVLIIRALLNSYLYYGNDFRVECPVGSGQMLTLFEVAREIAHRLSAIFVRDTAGNRPVFGGTERFQRDPHWRDYVLFYEYFHGDNGAGLGASHQTGWTGLIGSILWLFAEIKQDEFLEKGLGSLIRNLPLE